MEKIKELAKIIKKKSSNNRFLVGIYGIPGSGKSTLAAMLQQIIKDSVVVQMDGFHYTKRELEDFPDPKFAHDRRGAEFTFNSIKFCHCVQQLRDQQKVEIYAPSFDHQKGDPVENDILIHKSTKVVIIEGLYIAVKRDHWDVAHSLLDLTIMIDIPVAIAMERVIKRQYSNCSRQEATMRIETNDKLN
jgi:pantothenate kinase